MKRKLTEMITRSLAFVLSLGIASGAWADLEDWTGGAGEDTKVSTEANWEGNAQPTTTIRFSDAAAGKTVTFDQEYGSFALSANYLWVGSSASPSVFFIEGSLTNAVVWEASSTTCGFTAASAGLKVADASNQNGALWIKSGTYKPKWFEMGKGTAYLRVDGGTLDVTGDNFYIANGENGTAFVDIQGGTLKGQHMHTSNSKNAQDRINISGGEVALTGFITTALGESATSTIEVSGGTVTMGNDLELAYGASSTSSFTVSKGSVATVYDVQVGKGNGSSATLTISDEGVVTVGRDLIIANNAASSGTVNLNGGTLGIGGSVWAVGTGAINLDGTGVLTMNAKPSADNYDFIQSSVTINAGTKGGTINVGDGGYLIAVNAKLTGSGEIKKTGTRPLTLANANIAGFTGKITVAAGAGDVTLPGGKVLAAGESFNYGAYEWTGAGTPAEEEGGEATDKDLWGNPNNWVLANGSIPVTAPAADSTVVIPAGDGAMLTIKCAGSTDKTGFLTLERDVTLCTTGGSYTGIALSTVTGSGKLTLMGGNGTAVTRIFYLYSAEQGYLISCPLEIAGTVEYHINSGYLTLAGDLTGDGTFKAKEASSVTGQIGIHFSGKTSGFRGKYVGGWRYRTNPDRDGTQFSSFAFGSEYANWDFGWDASAHGDKPFQQSGIYYFGTLANHGGNYLAVGPSKDVSLHIGAIANGVSNVGGTLTDSSNKIVKVGDTSTLNLTLTEAKGAVEVEAGTLNLKGTVASESLTITGAGATVMVEDGNSAVPVLADSLTNDYTVVETAGEGFKTYKAAANCTITWKVDGRGDEVVQSYVGAVVSHANAERDGYVFDRWEPAVVSPATDDATYTAIWKTADVTVANPVVAYGADYTRATVTAAVNVTTPGDVTYELTVTKDATTQTYTGTVSGGTVTFADVAVPRDAADIYADITYTVTPKAGTAALKSAATTEAPTTKSEWAFSSRVNGDAVADVGGSWTAGAPTVAENKLAINDATFTAGKKSADDIVVITMEGVIFGDINDAEITGAQAGIRIGENGKFEVLSATGWTTTEISANGEEAYDVVLTINYATKKYSVKIGEGTKDDITLAGSETGVNAIEFNGSGSLASLAGEAYDGNMVVDKDGNKYATVAAAIKAYVANSSIAPLTMLHTGTEPAGWTIDENGVLAQTGIVVEEEETASTEVTTIVAVPYSTTTLTAATLINMSNRTEVDETLVLKVYDKTTKDYNSWTYEKGEWVANNVAKADAVSEETKTSKPAADVQLATGDGVWVTYNPQAPLILNGTYATAGSVHKTLEVGYNLIAPPPTGEATYSVRSITSATAGDKVVIPAGTGKPPRSLTRKDGNWGYWGVQNGQPVWVEVSEKADVTVPAGTGFWYISTSGAGVTL